MNPMVGYLPEELWPGILKFLPVKDLLKYRCVCRSWNAVIFSEEFLNHHFDSYTRNKDNSLLLYRQFSMPPLKQEEYKVFVDSVHQESEENLQVRHTFTCPFLPGVYGHYYFRVIGSVNGLICISDDDPLSGPLVILWNPLIRRYIKLPRVRYVGHNPIFGFGYDSQTRDHKVVRIDYFIKENGLIAPPPLLLVQIYSVRQGAWRVYENNFFQNICICEKWWSQCYVDKYICWIAWVRDPTTLAARRSCVLRFDVEREEFGVLRLPSELANIYPLEFRMSEYKGKLSVLFSKMKRRYTGNEMEIFQRWVYSGNSDNTWNKEVSFELNSDENGLSWIECSMKNGNLLGFTKEGEVASFDISTKETKRLGLFGRRCSWFTTSFTDSLVLLHGVNGVRTYSEAVRQGKKRHRFDDQDALIVVEEAADTSNEDEDGQNINDWVKTILERQLTQFVGGDADKLRNLLARLGI